MTIHRIAPKTRDGKPSGFYFKWYSDPDTGEIIAFERGPVGDDGTDIVDTGEELEKLETFPRTRRRCTSLTGSNPQFCPPPLHQPRRRRRRRRRTPTPPP